ncbi:MAG: hypothetical protein R6X02_03955 [Enhygromyxa sp.]
MGEHVEKSLCSAARVTHFTPVHRRSSLSGYKVEVETSLDLVEQRKHRLNWHRPAGRDIMLEVSHCARHAHCVNLYFRWETIQPMPIDEARTIADLADARARLHDRADRHHQLRRAAGGLGVGGGRGRAGSTRAAEGVRRFGVSGTPTFFVNGHYLGGAQPLESFKSLSDEELAADRLRP